MAVYITDRTALLAAATPFASKRHMQPVLCQDEDAAIKPVAAHLLMHVVVYMPVRYQLSIAISLC